MGLINVNVNGIRHDLTPEQVDDIISQAEYATKRQRAQDHADVEIAVAEMDEAMVAAGILPPFGEEH